MDKFNQCTLSTSSSIISAPTFPTGEKNCGKDNYSSDKHSSYVLLTMDSDSNIYFKPTQNKSISTDIFFMEGLKTNNEPRTNNQAQRIVIGAVAEFIATEQGLFLSNLKLKKLYEEGGTNNG